MGFENCRFVQCEVPETFLAATVNCVFEGCQFQGKRHVWPKETGPIKVTAYYTGQGAAPKSFINGPLTVEFLSMPRDRQAGSDLKHTYSAAHINLAALPMPAQFTMIGTTQKKASEIPAGSTPVKPASPPSVGTPASPAAPTPGRVDFRSLDDMVRGMPATVQLTKEGQFHVSGVASANEWLTQTASARTAVVRLMVDVMQATKEDGYAFKVTGREQILTVRGTPVRGRIIALFRAGPAAALTGVTKNRDLAVRGVVQKAILEGQGRNLALTVTLGEAEVQ
jgi:hypothetical protein